MPYPPYYPSPYYYNMQNMDPRMGKYISSKKDIVNVWREPYNPYMLPYHGQYPQPPQYLNYYNRKEDKKNNEE